MIGNLSEYAQRVDQVMKGSWFRLNPINLAVIAKQPMCAADSRPFTGFAFGDSTIEGKP